MGYGIFWEGGSVVDVVEGVVVVLEDDFEFNVGCGFVLNIDGEVEMDVSIMDGKDLLVGVVFVVWCIVNFIKFVWFVMEKIFYCFFID